MIARPGIRFSIGEDLRRQAASASMLRAAAKIGAAMVAKMASARQCAASIAPPRKELQTEPMRPIANVQLTPVARLAVG